MDASSYFTRHTLTHLTFIAQRVTVEITYRQGEGPPPQKLLL